MHTVPLKFVYENDAAEYIIMYISNINFMIISLYVALEKNEHFYKNDVDVLQKQNATQWSNI